MVGEEKSLYVCTRFESKAISSLKVLEMGDTGKNVLRELNKKRLFFIWLERISRFIFAPALETKRCSFKEEELAN